MADYNEIAAKAGRYMGSIGASSRNDNTARGGATEDAYGGLNQRGGRRFLWNLYLRICSYIGVKDTTDTWSYASTTIRQANGAVGNQVEIVVGLSLDSVQMQVFSSSANANNQAGIVYIGYDSIISDGGSLRNRGAINTHIPNSALLVHRPSIGRHIYAWLEACTGAGALNFLGDNGSTQDVQAGMYGTLFN